MFHTIAFIQGRGPFSSPAEEMSPEEVHIFLYGVITFFVIIAGIIAVIVGRKRS